MVVSIPSHGRNDVMSLMTGGTPMEMGHVWEVSQAVFLGISTGKVGGEQKQTDPTCRGRLVDYRSQLFNEALIEGLSQMAMEKSSSAGGSLQQFNMAMQHCGFSTAMIRG